MHAALRNRVMAAQRREFSTRIDLRGSVSNED